MLRRLCLIVSLLTVMLATTGGTLAQESPSARSQTGTPAVDQVVQEGAAIGAALGKAFTYQGQLKNGGFPVSGTCDLRFILYNAETGGAQVGPIQEKTGVGISDGLFTIPDLDFGEAFTGEDRWLEISLRCPAGTGTFTVLSPRQAIRPVPYAMNADMLDGRHADVFARTTSFDARQFGAKGDCTTNDTAAIQAALDAAASAGGEVVLAPGMYRITATLQISSGVTLAGYGSTSTYTDLGRAASVILKDGNFAGLLVSSFAVVRDLQVDGVTESGGNKCGYRYGYWMNDGDGIVLTGAASALESVAVTNQGGSGVRIASGTNTWRIYNLRVLHNRQHGLYIHDASPESIDANAGLLLGLDARENLLDGLCVEHAIDNQFFGVLAEHNEGYGIHLLRNARGNSFWMPYVECNRGVCKGAQADGQLKFEPGADQNIVYGTRSYLAGDAYVDAGADNLILGRSGEYGAWEFHGDLDVQKLNVNDNGLTCASAAQLCGRWQLRQNPDDRSLEIVGFSTAAPASSLKVKLLKSPEGTADLFVSGDLHVAGSITQGALGAEQRSITRLSEGQALRLLDALNPITYAPAAVGSSSGDSRVGFGTQDLPDLMASSDKNAVDPLAVISVLTKVVQQQQEELMALQAKVRSLAGR